MDNTMISQPPKPQDDISPWSHQVASHIAQKQGLMLCEQHWLIIEAARKYYQQHHTHISIRQLSAQLKDTWPDPLQLSIDFNHLFPEGLRQLSQVAGLPKPTRCL